VSRRRVADTLDRIVRVVANGTPYEIDPGTSVTAFVEARGLDPRFVIVEWNGEALERSRYPETVLADGDRLELVRAVAGGDDRGAARRARLAGSRLYVVTGAREEQGDLPAFLDAILAAGVDIVQLREKDAEAGDLLRWGARFAEAARRHGALFVVNDRADVALALGADGVHVGQNDLPPATVRGLVGPDLLIGLSTHQPDQWDAVPPEVDYRSVGPVFATPTKPGRAPTGVGYVRRVASRAAADGQPVWFAIGGLDGRTVPEVVASGARRLVVVRAVTDVEDPAAAVRSLLALLPPLDA
jgi:thiamine-phosphate pyrophosphorylase